MYVCAPTGLIPFWLQFCGYGCVCVVCVVCIVPFGLSEKPVHQFCGYYMLPAGLVVGDRVQRAHSVFRVPRGRGVHTAH